MNQAQWGSLSGCGGVASRLLALIALLAANSLAQSPSPLKAAATALDNKRYADALAALKTIHEPKLADYIAWLSARASFELNDDAAVLESLKPVWSQLPRSPLLGEAAMLVSRVYVRSNAPKNGADFLKTNYDHLPQPDGDLSLALDYEAAKDYVNAATYYQRVYIYYPQSTAATDAEDALVRIGNQLGSAYPATSATAMLTRAQKLLEGGAATKARTEFETLVPLLKGVDNDFARVRIGVAQYNARQNAAAFEYLRGLQVPNPEQDAERLYYLVQCARRLSKPDDVTAILDQFSRQYPKSPRRLDAFVSIATQTSMSNQPSPFEAICRRCTTEFAGVSQAAPCHWRIAFLEYMRRGPGAAALLTDHVRLYPDSDKITAAMYFLGRLAELSRDTSTARAWYDEINTFYPNNYYAVLARTRLGDASISGAAPSAATVKFLRSVNFPQRIRRFDFNAGPTAQQRIERARLLSAAGLDDFAETELRYGARTETSPMAVAVSLADLEVRRQLPERGIRYLKQYGAGYLRTPIEPASLEFWKLAFPLPYRESVERFSKLAGIDPNLVAALIRQESEFDAKVVSHANAYGLTQVLPSTGRMLSRSLGIKQFQAKMLFDPEVNLQLGTSYLKSLFASLDNRWEATLAAYNAGKSRSVAWLGWFDYREPAEFVEMIPFNETRTYVQSVLRNADIYRRLYGGTAR